MLAMDEYDARWPRASGPVERVSAPGPRPGRTSASSLPREKDPERVRLGRLGALTVHARGRTNVGPARDAWRAALAAEFGITDELPPAERERRMRAAMRVRMARLSSARWHPDAVKSPKPAARTRRNPQRPVLGALRPFVPEPPIQRFHSLNDCMTRALEAHGEKVR